MILPRCTVYNKSSLTSGLAGVFILAALFISFSLPAQATAKNLKIKNRFSGSFLTNVAGSSISRPPYIQVIRSKEGLDYLMRRFTKIKNRITHKRVKRLEKSLGGVNFKRNMLVGVFSQPMDNYSMTLKKAEARKDNKTIDIRITYQHKLRNLRIPPKKSIHYLMFVVSKSDYPVILSATEVINAGKKNKAQAKIITVTGRLMALRGDDLQLVPVVIRRGRKSSYYIRGQQAEPLSKHTGKVVTLQGTVSHERDSPYEWNFTVNKVVKVFN